MIKDFVAWLIRLICGARRLPEKLCPRGSVVYFANRSSHLDFATLKTGDSPIVFLKARAAPTAKCTTANPDCAHSTAPAARSRRVDRDRFL